MKTNREAWELGVLFKSYGEVGGKLGYAMMRNAVALSEAFLPLEAAVKPVAELREYNARRAKAMESKATAIRPLPNGNSAYTIDPAKQAELDAEMAALAREYAEPLAKARQQEVDFEALLDEECTAEFVPYRFKLSKHLDAIRSRDQILLMQHGCLIDDVTDEDDKPPALPEERPKA